MIFNIFLSFFSILYFHLYYKIFRNYNSQSVSGVGAIIPILVLVISFLYPQEYSINYYLFLSLLCVFTIIYLIDDIKNLPISIRILIQFLSGFACFYFIADFNFISNSFILLLFSIIFGLWTIFFVNLVNFYDGNDINVSTLILIFLFFLLIFAIIPNFVILIIFSIINFIFIFSFFNFFYSKYYFGDSGCFAVANLINFLLLLIFKKSSINLVLFITPFFLPIIDVLFVIILRLNLREPIYTRNYYHLYQKIALDFKGYWYILPTIIFPIFFSFINYQFLYILNINQILILTIDLPIIVFFYFFIMFYLRK